MYPPVFAVCSAAAGVTALLGVSPCRLYPFGSAPQGESRPYAVWQFIGGSPENYVNQAPDIDSLAIQVDCYATTGSAARNVAKALRDAIEPQAHIVSWRGEGRDEKSKLYRYSFDVDWWASR